MCLCVFEQLKDNKKWDIFMLQKENERIMKQVKNKTYHIRTILSLHNYFLRLKPMKMVRLVGRMHLVQVIPECSKQK